MRLSSEVLMESGIRPKAATSRNDRTPCSSCRSPHITREVIQQAIATGVKNIWMQLGAEDAKGSLAARDAGLNVIDDGSCILVSLSTERSSK